MSLETSALIQEARRQLEICNACRYCEGFCSVFPAMMREKMFSDGDISHMSNLCHNCRGCYYSCQYAPPHEFQLNLPAALAEVSHDSWQSYMKPQSLARLFKNHGMAIMALAVVATTVMIWVAINFRPEAGEGFYAFIAHNVMVAIFAPAFLLPLAVIFLGLRRYWQDTGGLRPTLDDITGAFGSVARLKNLSGGHGDGCNFEKEDRYSNARRYAHQAVLYGFLLCFAATSAGTVMHYVLDMPAPYSLFSLPKLLGIPGGILLVLGTVEMARLKLKADADLGARRAWSGEMAFVVLLGLTGATGLILYAATGRAAVSWLLPLHLGTVLTFFLLLPFSKMVHGFFRVTALIIEEQKKKYMREVVTAD